MASRHVLWIGAVFRQCWLPLLTDSIGAGAPNVIVHSPFPRSKVGCASPPTCGVGLRFLRGLGEGAPVDAPTAPGTPPVRDARVARPGDSIWNRNRSVTAHPRPWRAPRRGPRW